MCCAVLAALQIIAISASTAPLDDAARLADSARAVEAPVYAPKAFKEGLKKLRDAQTSVERGRKQSIVDGQAERAQEHFQNALKATEVARLTLSAYIPPRERARAAQAHELVPELYAEAEEQFVKATEKVESGDTKGGLREAEKAVVLFDTAELEAIRVDVLGPADSLLAEARKDEGEKFAPVTLNNARNARASADSALTYDRYNRDEAERHAGRAEYEARHASTIARTVRSIERNDQAWERVILLYESEMSRVGQTLEWERLPFDRGPAPAADSLVAAMDKIKEFLNMCEEERRLVSDLLAATLRKSGTELSVNDPKLLARALDEYVTNLVERNEELARRAATEEQRLTELSETHAQVTAALEKRQEHEARLRKARAIINPSEGEVLLNTTGDLVLRLTGLSFASGKSDITDQHLPLLEKVSEILEMYPDNRIAIEGHTDAAGDEATNRQLSERRALAVMQYLRRQLQISADRMTSIGYGPDRPAAPNTTAEGRAKNRRIEVVIMQ
jgi:outer membrane protein OmpA-like peptidoglycan-associated protein